LINLGVKLGDLAIPALVSLDALLVEYLGEFSADSRFQAAIWVGCSSCLAASSATVSWPLIASSADLAWNSAKTVSASS
jgi:hypothetical protein